MEFAIVAAVDSARGIGIKGVLPWRLKGDLGHFRDLTTREWQPGRQNAVIMGRVTWLSLPERFRPLPNRLNLVLSREPIDLPAGVLRAVDMNQALALAQDQQAGKIFIIGGGSVYAQAIARPECVELYLTEVEGDFGCDTFFPEIPPVFKRTSESEPVAEGGITYQFVTYEKI